MIFILRYFQRLLEGDMKESREDEVMIVLQSDVNYFLALVR